MRWIVIAIGLAALSAACHGPPHDSASESTRSAHAPDPQMHTGGHPATPSTTPTPATTPARTELAPLASAPVPVPAPSDPTRPSRPHATASSAATPTDVPTRPPTTYPWHSEITATTFWVGEVFEPGPDGSQVISAYDDDWLTHYGGCDGLVTAGTCQTERRVAANGFFPLHMTPQQNPFYLDVPFDDVNNARAASIRADVIPWARQSAYRDILADPTRSLMKNRWVEIRRGPHVCFGQIQDAGPGVYDDDAYVFGDQRPRNDRFNNAGLDVSPALNGCLHFTEINGESDTVDWRFVERSAVPDGPWTRIETHR